MSDGVSAAAAAAQSTTTASTLTFGQLGWLWPALLLVVVATVVLVWGYRRAGRFDAVRNLAFVCKLIAVALIAACLLEPLWTSPSPKTGANVVVVLADNSRGMQIKSTAGGESRGETQSALVKDSTSGWLKSLDDNFDVRRYLFDANVTRSVDLPTDLHYNGQASDLGAALKEVATRYQHHSLAAVVVLSDGSATDINGTFDSTGLPPVYTVPIGSPTTETDLAIQNVSVVTSNFEDAPVTVHADIHLGGFAGQRAAIRLTDASGKLLEEQKIDATTNDHTSKLRFQIRPEKQGVVFYNLDISAAPTDETSLQAPPIDEVTSANNHKSFVVDRGQGPYRILYVSGRPNWEYKFINRALESDEQVRLVGLIRIAKREPKFEFSGRAGDNANPLFTGIDTGAEERTYDKPVLVRLNVMDKDELVDGFPKTAEVLFAYHAIIIDDVESEFFTRDQMELIQRYVSERGGGLMMLGGVESFEAGKYDNTPIGEALPVYTRASQNGSPLGGANLELTREGLLEAWARLRDQADAEQQRLAELPRFEVVNQTTTIKPGASLLATARTPSGQQIPALVAQRYGKGRSVALTIGDAWRAGLSMDPIKTEDLGKFWRQTIRWLIADVPGRVTIAIDPASGITHPTRLRMLVTDKSFKPLDNADATFVVTPPQGDPITLTAEPTANAPGEFQAVYLAAEPGTYHIAASAKTTNGEDIGQSAAGFVIDPDAQEFASIQPNRALLETISRQTGGRVLTTGELAGLADDLLNRDAPIMEAKTTPLWHNAWVLAAIIALLVGEWILRRKRGMA